MGAIRVTVLKVLSSAMVKMASRNQATVSVVDAYFWGFCAHMKWLSMYLVTLAGGREGVVHIHPLWQSEPSNKEDAMPKDQSRMQVAVKNSYKKLAGDIQLCADIQGGRSSSGWFGFSLVS